MPWPEGVSSAPDGVAVAPEPGDLGGLRLERSDNVAETSAKTDELTVLPKCDNAPSEERREGVPDEQPEVISAHSPPPVVKSGCCVACGSSDLSKKYRCPRCRAPYCSLACCKEHKVTCVATTRSIAAPKAQLEPAELSRGSKRPRKEYDDMEIMVRYKPDS